MLNPKSQSVHQDKYKGNPARCQNIQKYFEKTAEFEKLDILHQQLMEENTRCDEEQKLRPLQTLKRKEIRRSIGRSSENQGSKIGYNCGCKSIDSPSVKKRINRQAEQKTQRQKLKFISEKWIKHHKNRIKNRRVFPEKRNSVQHKNLQCHKKNNHQDVGKKCSAYHFSLFMVACNVS